MLDISTSLNGHSKSSLLINTGDSTFPAVIHCLQHCLHVVIYEADDKREVFWTDASAPPELVSEATSQEVRESTEVKCLPRAFFVLLA